MRSTAVISGVNGRDLIRQHALLALLAACYLAIAILLSRQSGVITQSDKGAVVFRHFLTKVPQLVIVILFWRLLVLTYVDKVPDRMAALRSEVWEFLTDRQRLLGGAIATLIMTIVLLSYAQMKTLIPVIQPFDWDIAFMSLDRALHFGIDPYRILHAFLGWDLSLVFFTGMYNVWLILAYFVLFGACFMRPDNPARLQFLIAFLLTWAVGGNLIATIFSSAGPPYYALLGFGDAYAPLFEKLNAHAATGALTVVDTQALLWRFYTLPESVNAISAFPSMHVASSVLMALIGFKIARYLGIALSIFAGLMMIGSVLLGWHYAVDGYVGAMVAVAVWLFSGWLVRSSVGPFPAAAS